MQVANMKHDNMKNAIIVKIDSTHMRLMPLIRYTILLYIILGIYYHLTQYIYFLSFSPAAYRNTDQRRIRVGYEAMASYERSGPQK